MRLKELAPETCEEYQSSQVFGMELTQTQLNAQRKPIKPPKQVKKDRRRRGRKIKRNGK